MIAIKPHHFVDILTAFGGGRTEFQPHPYGEGNQQIAEAAAALARQMGLRLVSTHAASSSAKRATTGLEILRRESRH